MRIAPNGLLNLRGLMLLTAFVTLAPLPVAGQTPPPEDTAGAETAPNREVQFWRLQHFLRMNTAPFRREADLHLPGSTPTQEILSLRHYSPDYEYAEEHSGANVRGIWTAKAESNGTNWIIYDAVFKTTPQLKPKKLASSSVPATSARVLSLTDAENTLLNQKILELGLDGKSLHKKIRVLFDFIANSLEKSGDDTPLSIAAILESNKTDDAGRIRLFGALLARLDIPTRQVSGLLLMDRKIKRRYHTWMQAWLNDQWLNFDFAHGLFASLTSDHAIIGTGDRPAIKITPGADYQFHFVLNKLSEENAMDPGDLVIPQKDLIADDYFKTGDKKESFVSNAIGRIAIITEKPIADSIIEKIAERAALSQTKVYFYSSPYESHFFRGGYIAKLLSQNIDTLKQTDAIYIQSDDDAGLYALFRLARDNKRLKKSTIIVNGGIATPVANILGHTLFKLLKPKDLFIAAEPMGVERAWDILEDHVLDGLPITEVGHRWNIPFIDLSAKKKNSLSAWRQFLVKTWMLATEAEVNLESIYLTLMLPLIALVIVIFRNVIGLETFGTFTPVIISVAFLTTGLFWGMMIFFTIVATGILFRVLFRSIHIHLVARMAMLIAIVGMTMLAVIIVGVHWGWGALINISILPMVIMARIVEDFTRTQMEAGTKQALRFTLNTLMVAVISYLLIDAVGAQSLVLVFPEVILVALFLEILIGRWNGIRLSEYLRFYRIIGPPSVAPAEGVKS